ncbi:endonuclease/exonuclease/phosphatase family protein, partial [Cooperia oncophora]
MSTFATQKRIGLTSPSGPEPNHLVPTSLLDEDGITLLNKIHGILSVKAPEVIQLLDQFLGRLPLIINEAVDRDKRLRSLVFYGVPEAGGDLSPSARQAHTEKVVTGILDSLNIETRPAEVYRMGRGVEGKPRLVKCVFYSRRISFDILSKAHRLRSTHEYRDVYIRKSMTIDERKKDRELRERARELEQERSQKGKQCSFVVKKLVYSRTSFFSCFLFNARSLKNKIHDLHCLIEILKPGIIFITETWLTSKIADSELCSVFPYSVVRKDRVGKTGGGVCALLHNFFLYDEVKFDCKVLSADVLCFDVFLPSSRNHRFLLIFLLIYRPPQSTLSQDEQLVTVISDLVSTSPHHVTILGDLNLNIDWCSHVALNSEAQKFLSAFESLSLEQLVTFPTRGNKILDIILADGNFISDISARAPFGSSDHDMISFNISECGFQNKLTRFIDFLHADKGKIRQALSDIDWLEVLNFYADADDAYNRFASVIHNIISRHVPIKYFEKCASSRYPKHIVNLFEQRERLFHSFNGPSMNPLFIEVSRKLDFHLKRFLAYKVRKMAQSNHMKKLYEFIKKVKSTSHVSHILVDSDGRKYSTDASKAEAIADYFASVFGKASSGIQSLPSVSNECFEMPIVSPHVVLKHLRSLKRSMSPTADGIPQVFYKEFSDYLAIPLAHILNICLLLGEVPSVWKNSFVTPLPKTYKYLTDPAENNGEDSERKALHWVSKLQLIPTEQHGFLPGASTCTQLIDCTHSWTEALNSGK